MLFYSDIPSVPSFIDFTVFIKNSNKLLLPIPELGANYETNPQKNKNKIYNF